MSFWQAALPAAAATAAGLGAWGVAWPTSQLFGRAIARTGRADTLALTFDDGPNPAVTPGLLELLERHHVTASFFLIGRWARAHAALAREISARGHLVGNHTGTHSGTAFLSAARMAAEVRAGAEAIEAATGIRPRWLRPPFGRRGPAMARVAREAGLAGVVMWSRSAHDYRAEPPARVTARLGRARGGDILLLHDGDPARDGADRTNTLAALAQLLPRWKDAGLRMVTPDEIVL